VIDVHERNPEATVTIAACVQNSPIPSLTP
jgi:hypothetical protein